MVPLGMLLAAFLPHEFRLVILLLVIWLYINGWSSES